MILCHDARVTNAKRETCNRGTTFAIALPRSSEDASRKSSLNLELYWMPYKVDAGFRYSAIGATDGDKAKHASV